MLGQLQGAQLELPLAFADRLLALDVGAFPPLGLERVFSGIRLGAVALLQRPTLDLELALRSATLASRA